MSYEYLSLFFKTPAVDTGQRVSGAGVVIGNTVAPSTGVVMAWQTEVTTAWINERAEDGWELLSVVLAGGPVGPGHFYYFRRPKLDDTGPDVGG